jgi:hypothetical protein
MGTVGKVCGKGVGKVWGNGVWDRCGKGLRERCETVHWGKRGGAKA